MSQLINTNPSKNKNRTTVGWDLAVQVLRQASNDIQEPHAQEFLGRYLNQIVSILLDQRCVRTRALMSLHLHGFACG